MSNKKYYFMKIKDDFLDRDDIKWLISEPDGPQYVCLYLALCIRSLRHEGKLIQQVGNDEIFAEGDIVIQSHMDDMVSGYHMVFQKEKPQQVHRRTGRQQKQIPILFPEAFLPFHHFRLFSGDTGKDCQ